jgi:uncharacterized protein YndB with AHSA1/START domain
MLTVEYTDTFDFPAAAVFALLTDLEKRSKWITGILEIRVTPPGPARLGTSYFEAGKFSGYKSEKTMIVTEFEQDRLLTLATPTEVRNSFRETYRIEPISDKSCRVNFTIEVGGAPKVAEFFMQQAMKKAQPQQVASLRSLLASQLHKAS